MTNVPDDGLRRAKVALLLTMAMWGVNMSAVKLLTGYFDMLWLAFFRMGLATLAMSWLVIPAIGAVRQVHRGDAARLLACAALMVYGNQILLLGGICTSSATNASLIIALSPIVALVIASVALRERMRMRAALGVALGFGGVAAIILNGAAGEVSDVGRGDVMMLLSIVCFCLGGAMVQRLTDRLPPALISWIIYAVGSAMLLAHALIAPDRAAVIHTAGLGVWMILFFSGAVSTGIGNLVWNRSISSIGVGRTTSALYWVPVFGVLFAIVFLGESASVWHLAGLAGVVGGTWLTSSRTETAPD